MLRLLRHAPPLPSRSFYQQHNAKTKGKATGSAMLWLLSVREVFVSPAWFTFRSLICKYLHLFTVVTMHTLVTVPLTVAMAALRLQAPRAKA
jgi:hypothetical protein